MNDIKLPNPTKEMMEQALPFRVTPNGGPPAWFSKMLRDSGILDSNGDMSASGTPVDDAVIIRAVKKNVK